MATDFTQQQTVGEQMRAEELSLRATVPPSTIPGYRIESLLGQGAFGQVWVGTDLNTGRSVAIKFYLHRSGVNWSLLAREVKNLVTMSANRFIVQVLDVGWDAEPPYYVMEYLENGSLEELLRQRGALSVSKAVEIFTDVALGLNHLHGKGVLHCDLKPANVLLDQDMRPRLADFGQSRMSDDQTPSLGTLFYMAPEQADLNALPDARWDVYALGAIFYCMIVGSPPHRTPQTVTALDTANNLTDRLTRYRETILKASTPRAHHRVPGIDRSLIGIIDRCLSKSPSDRFGNVQQLIGALERRESSRLRRPLIWLGIVAPLILLSVMGFFGWRAISIAEREATSQIRNIAMQRNEKTANFAASALESELERLFRMLEHETERPEFRRFFSEFTSAAGDELLSSLATQTPLPEPLKKLLEVEERRDLENYIQDRFERILSETTKSPNEEARFASLFISDRYGNLVASSFVDSQEASKIGWNFAWRSYFNGLRQDFPPSVPRRTIEPTAVSHVSVPFKSTTSQRWKIAVCSPIMVPSKNDSDSTIVNGVLVLTINLGNLDLIPTADYYTKAAESQENQSRGEDVIAVLVDGHEGPREGTLLQHPMLKLLGKQAGQDEDKLQLSEEQMLALKDSEGSFDYQDPVAKHPLGKAYEGDWIATMRPVDVSGRLKQSDVTEGEYSTNLYLLVQERADQAVAPVNQLVMKLAKEGWFAFFSVVGLISALWYFVFRVIRVPDQPSLGARLRSNTETFGSAAQEATVDVG
jgi:eukaryotic-like serine/threonine-protein kinase